MFSFFYRRERRDSHPAKAGSPLRSERGIIRGAYVNPPRLPTSLGSTPPEGGEGGLVLCFGVRHGTFFKYRENNTTGSIKKKEPLVFDGPVPGIIQRV